MQILANYHKEDIHSVGLVFEPNFFTLYFYSDREGKNLVGSERVKSGGKPTLENFKDLYPLYALTFVTNYTLLPNNLFQEELADQVLSFNTSSNSNNVDWNSDPGLGAKIIFERDLHNEQYLDTVFPGLQLKHGITAVLNYIRNSASEENCFLILENGSNFTLVCVANGSIEYLNTIDAKHEEDVLHFLVHVFKTLGLNSEIPIYLLGAAAEHAKLKELISKYYYKVNSESGLIHSSQDVDLSPAIHWLGIHADKCAL